MIRFILGIIIAWLLTRVIKTIIDWSNEKRLSFKSFFRDGGMPSNHTAITVATATCIFLETGLSYIFVLSAVVALIVMNDALKVRWITGEQSKAINRLAKGKKGFAHLEERVGHTPLEVLVGAIIGIIIPIMIYSLITIY